MRTGSKADTEEPVRLAVLLPALMQVIRPRLLKVDLFCKQICHTLVTFARN